MQCNQNIIQYQTDLVTGFFFVCVCRLVKKGKLIKHNLRQDVDINLLDQPEVGNLARTSCKATYDQSEISRVHCA